jgi:hypothetical protein
LRLDVPRPAVAGLSSWCLRYLGATPTTQLFEKTHLSSVIGLRLSDGREVVVKARPPLDRIESCQRLHRHLYDRGYPCAEPLVAPAPLGDLIATAERIVPEGETMAESAVRPRLFAEALHRLVASASTFEAPFDLSPTPPWVGWNHGGAALWPTADDRDDDLNALTEPAWLDDMGRRLRERLLADSGQKVIGHGDWWQPNIWWRDGGLFCVHDWDSLVYLSEAAIAGAASSSFSVIDWGATTVEESEAFLDAYAAARAAPWSRDELEVAWAAGLWQLAFNAKKDLYEGVTTNIEHCRVFGPERLRRAGC